MKRLLFVSLIQLSFILSLSCLNNVSAQSWLENKSALNGIVDAGSNIHGLINHSTVPRTFTEEVKEKDHSDDLNKDDFFVAGIPGRIEAENWDDKFGGMYAIPSTDPTGGGMMVVGINSTQNYLDYNVNVASTGTYTVSFRLATPQFPVFQLKLGNTVLATFNITPTGEWNIWQTFTVTGVPLTAGAQTLRVFLATPGASANFNWMDFSLQSNNSTVVTNNLDAGPGSLRQVVLNASPGSTITFDMNTVTSPISLSGGRIIIDKNLTIQGPGANLLTVQNTKTISTTSYAFHINNGVTTTISGLTVSGGNVNTFNTGGGITNFGNLTLTNSVVKNNSITGYSPPNGTNYYGGGGIFIKSATLNINNSTISNNTGPDGGGIYSVDGIVNLTNSTVSANTANVGSFAGGIYSTGSGSTLTLTNSTVSGNQATTNLGGGGGIYSSNSSKVNLVNSTITNNTSNPVSGTGGVWNNAGTVNSVNSIIAGNTAPVAPDFSGSVISQGYNLVGKSDGSSGFTQATDLKGTIASPLDPVLGPLADNGGPTWTNALLASSPAIDKGSAVAGITTDQRGSVRPYDNLSITNAAGGNGSDIGAFEAAAGTVIFPTANAGPNQDITLPTSQVTLAGSGTANNGGSIIAHTWTLFSGGSSIITDPSNYNTTVTGLSAGTYVFRLTVIQNDNLTAFGDVTITVNPATSSSPTWNTLGNSAINPATNFLGTTDNNRLVFRTNNTEKMTILPNGKVGIGTIDPQVSLHLSENPGAITAFPYEVAVLEKAGDMKLGVFNSNPSPLGLTGGGASITLGYSNFINTSGRYPGYEMQFSSQSSSTSFLRFNAVQRNSAGAIATGTLTNVLVLDNNGNVGINLGSTTGTFPILPTAKFHTNGTVRHENLPTGTGNVLVVDANGNVFRSTAVASVANNAIENSTQVELNDKIRKLEEEIESLRTIVNSMKGGTLDIDVNRDNPFLYQNTPNPFSNITTIRYYLPSGFQNAVLEISDLQGRVLKNYQLSGTGKQSATINANELSSGTYFYTLIVNEKRVDSKKMVLTR